MAKTAARDLAETVLPGASLGLTSGTNCFYDNAPHDKAVSAPIVGIFNAGGLDPLISADSRHYSTSIQVLVVGAPLGYTAAETLVDSIRQYFLKTFKSRSVGSTKYTGVYQQGETTFLGYSEESRPMFSANFILHRTYT